MHIDHINIAAPADLVESVKEFYCELLGLKEGFRPGLSVGGYWLYAGDEAIIHLSQSSGHHPSDRQGYFDHFALRTSGLPAILEKLDAMKISYTNNFVPETDLTQLFFKDPSGTGVELQFIGEPVE